MAAAVAALVVISVFCFPGRTKQLGHEMFYFYYPRSFGVLKSMASHLGMMVYLDRRGLLANAF
jgi:hypothetical protein